MHAPAKKDGAGGKYTWGGNMDVMDYEPYGPQHRNVVTSQARTPDALPRQPSARTMGVATDSDSQFPPLSREGVQQAARGQWQKGVGLALDLKSRAQEAAGQVQQVASDQVITPVARRVRKVTSNAQKTRVSLFKYVSHYMRCATGMVAWGFGAAIEDIKSKGVRAWAVDTARAAPDKARAAAAATRKNAANVAAAARELAKDKGFQTTATSAAGGAVALGTTGGTVGLVAGLGLGAAAGLPAALFTFGLSIPISAAIGGTMGLVTGATAGGAVGAVGAGAVGYGAYHKRDQINGAVSAGRQRVSDAANKTVSAVSSSPAYAKEKAGAAAEFVGEKVGTLRSRFGGGRS